MLQFCYRGQRMLWPSRVSTVRTLCLPRAQTHLLPRNVQAFLQNTSSKPARQNIVNGACQRPNPHFPGLGSRYEVVPGRKRMNNELRCSCRQSPAEICHLESAKPEFLDFGLETDNVIVCLKCSFSRTLYVSQWCPTP